MTITERRSMQAHYAKPLIGALGVSALLVTVGCGAGRVRACSRSRLAAATPASQPGAPVVVSCEPNQRTLVRPVVVNGATAVAGRVHHERAAADRDADRLRPRCPSPYRQVRAVPAGHRGDDLGDARMVPVSQPATVARPIPARQVVYTTSRCARTRTVKKSAIIIGSSAGAGAGVGAAIGGKKGALIGAAIGGGGAALWDQITRRDRVNAARSRRKRRQGSGATLTVHGPCAFSASKAGRCHSLRARHRMPNVLLISSALALGFLHGLGADHLMAIAALSLGAAGETPAVQRARALGVAVRFAIGHALLLALGAGALVALGWSLPLVVERGGESARRRAAHRARRRSASGASLAGRSTATRIAHGHEPAAHWHLHIGRQRSPSAAVRALAPADDPRRRVRRQQPARADACSRRSARAWRRRRSPRC